MAPAETLGEGWQQQLQQLQSERSYQAPSVPSKGVPPLPRKFVVRGDVEAPESLRPPTFQRRGPRPGVDEASWRRSVEIIQRRWREVVQYRRLMLAKKQLAVGASTVDQAMPVKPRELRPPEEFYSLSLPQEELWDEAIFYRQPSVDQVLQAQLRWCKQNHPEEIASLSDLPMEILQKMRTLEGRLQLKMRGGAWRPPCAVGPCARQSLEEMLASARELGSGHMPPSLVPAAALFQLCLVSSCMHWMELQLSYQHLEQLEASLHQATTGSYAEAVSPALHGRCTLLRAFLALRQQHFGAAEAAARDALETLSARHFPRDFWPPHCWELAACHRICAVALCASGRPARALGELQVLTSLLAPDGQSSSMVARLKEEVATLQLEVEVVLDVDHSTDRCGVASSVLQGFLRRARAQRSASSDAVRGRLELLSAKLVLLEELPWFVAGGARTEAVHEAHQWIIQAERSTKQVLPAQCICAAFMEDEVGAKKLAERWVKAEASAESEQLVSVLSNPRHPAAHVPGVTQVMAKSLAKVACPC